MQTTARFLDAKVAADVFCVLGNVTSHFMMWSDCLEDMLDFHEVDLYNISERHYLWIFIRAIDEPTMMSGLRLEDNILLPCGNVASKQYLHKDISTNG